MRTYYLSNALTTLLIKKLPPQYLKLVAIILWLIILAIGVKTVTFLSQEKSEVIGIWQGDVIVSVSNCRELLREQGFSQDEILLINSSPMHIAHIWEFQPNGKYSYYCDQESTRDSLLVFYEVFFEALYANRLLLFTGEEATVTDCSLEEFKLHYAVRLGMDSAEDMINMLVESAIQSGWFPMYNESGRFQIDGVVDWIPPGESGEFKLLKLLPDGKYEFAYYQITDQTIAIFYRDALGCYQYISASPN